MNLSTGARARLAIGLCVALSAALHVLVLQGLLRSPPPRAAAGEAASIFLQGRLVQSDLPSAAMAAGTPPPSRKSAPARATASLEGRPATRSLPPEAPAAAAPPPPAAVADGDEDGYLPRSQLSVVPVLITPVTIPEPPDTEAAQMGARVGVVALYIDEAGRVRDVQPQEPRLPPGLEEVVRQSFLAARYAPGQRDGRVVKSRIRIEVVFQARAMGPPP